MKPSTFLGCGSLVVALVLSATVAVAQSEPSGSWLDSTTNWNTANASIPQAPTYQEGNNLSGCQEDVRPAALPEDELVKAAGWTLTGSAQINGATTLVQGMANADGMCRPLDYQVFVFQNGAFAGTLSPIPMDSRTDGSLTDFNLDREGSIGASFNRYAPEDPLCCASRESSISYQVEMQNNKPVLHPSLPANTYSPAQ